MGVEPARTGSGDTETSEQERRQREKAEAKARREEEKRLEEERRAAAEEADRIAREKAAKEAAARAVEAVGAAGGFNVMGVMREVAKPRLTGSHGAEEVGGTVRACFEALGYDVEARDFQFSPWPGRFGITVAGVLFLIGTVAAAAFLYAGNAYGALAILLVLFVLLGMLALLIRPAIDAMPWGRKTGTNLMATLPGARPRYIVMAHRDSKSQPVPLAFRGPAIVVGVLSWLALVVAALAHTARPLHPAIILALGVLAAVSGLILIFCWVDNRSPGALDNASGVVTALNIAAREADAGDVAFLITDAEELGLAGARAAAPHLPAVFGVINIDGLDDDGPFYVLERFGIIRKQGLAPHLAAALLQEAESRGEAADRRDLPFGIPVDHIPVVKAGTPALTLMRGTMRSLRRVHRPVDDLEALQGDGVRRGADLICGALARLREQSRVLER
ncbi:MAG TPA: M28 family peptidase [Longimicrobiales bacterium]|nr:M28 family peptidase [Longimicrobiales bacterium]